MNEQKGQAYRVETEIYNFSSVQSNSFDEDANIEHESIMYNDEAQELSGMNRNQLYNTDDNAEKDQRISGYGTTESNFT